MSVQENFDIFFERSFTSRQNNDLHMLKRITTAEHMKLVDLIWSPDPENLEVAKQIINLKK